MESEIYAFVAVNKNGIELISDSNLVRGKHQSNDGFWFGGTTLLLPKGSIKKLIGRELTWEDEPVALKNNI